MSAGTAPFTPARYLDGLQDGFHATAAVCGEIVVDLSVGPAHLRVAFAGAELAGQLLPSLDRLRMSASSIPTATFTVWDSASAGVPAPELPIRPALGAEQRQYRFIYTTAEGRTDSLAMYDRGAGRGVLWFSSAGAIRWHDRAEPLRAAIHWALTTPDTYLAHASAVGDARGAIVLTGRGGAGKTTTTLACLEAGLRFVSDNYVLLSTGGSIPRVHGLYGAAKLWPATLHRLPGLADLVRNPEAPPDEKLVVDVARHRPDLLATDLPVRAVVVPEVRGVGPTLLAPCSAVDALLAMAPATLLQLPRSDRGFDGMADLVRQIPTFRLSLGEDIADGPRAISALLDQTA